MKARNRLVQSLALAGATSGVLLLGVSCGGPKSGLGFSLPDGDVERGRAAFIRLDCTRCHTVADEVFDRKPENMDLVVPLGGEVQRVKTYGQLVTSIINPQHLISSKYKKGYTDEEGRSLMPDLNEKMTVAEMIDIVTYLQSHYRLTPPEPAYYGYP